MSKRDRFFLEAKNGNVQQFWIVNNTSSKYAHPVEHCILAALCESYEFKYLSTTKIDCRQP